MFWKKTETKVISLDILTMKCDGCGTCAVKCRNKAIWIKRIEDRAYAWYARPELCTGCGKCAKICPNGAIQITARIGNPAII